MTGLNSSKVIDYECVSVCGCACFDCVCVNKGCSNLKLYQNLTKTTGLVSSNCQYSKIHHYYKGFGGGMNHVSDSSSYSLY